MLIFLMVQNGLFSKLPRKMNRSQRETPPEQRKRFSRLEYSHDRTNSKNTSTNNDIFSAGKLNIFTKESVLRFTPRSTEPTLRNLKKRKFLEVNEKQKSKTKYNQTAKKFWSLREFPGKNQRNKRSVENLTERAVSSHISLQITETTIRVDFSEDSTERSQDLRPAVCRFITNDNRRLIENLADAINCGSYPVIENGHFELFLGDLDDDIEPRMKCDRYYVRQGPIDGGLVCVDRKWYIDASCEKIRCKKELETPLNGQNISMKGNQFNDTASFSCAYGYELIGDEVMLCGEDGEWIGEIPTCKLVQCPNVTAPDHGFLSNKLEADSNETSLILPDFNTTIMYHCEEGYTLVGKSEITCEADGTWSQRKKPQCKKVCLVPFTKRLTSTVWLQPYMNPLNVRSEFQFGQQIIYLCRKRYKSVNDGEAMCVNGTWVPPIQCRRIYTCTDPLPPKNGRITDRINRSFVQYTCDYGYQISGSNAQTCLSNGTWSGTKPKCRKMCRMPQVFAMKDAWLSLQFTKFHHGNQLLVGSTIEYSCKNSYQKASNISSVCNDGKWIPEPRCLSKIVRLTGSKNESEGLLEVYINGKWGLVCDHLFIKFGVWDDDESKVVCKMLGYSSGSKTEAANYQRITKHITYQSVSCSGEEKNILACDTMKARVWCDRFIAVKCFGRTIKN